MHLEDTLATCQFCPNSRTNVPKPAVIVQPSNPQDIIEALKFARNYNMRISVMSTGHHQDVRNIYDNSVHIDMSSMNSKSIDIQNKRLTVGSINNDNDNNNEHTI